MKQKEKRLEYAHQYQIMCAKKLRKFVFSDEKKFNFDGLDGFQKYWHTKKFPEENYSTRHSGGRSLMISGCSHLQGKLKLRGRQKTADYVKMLNDLSLTNERRRLCGEE